MKTKVVLLCRLPIVAKGIEALLADSTRFWLVATVSETDNVRTMLVKHHAPLLLAELSQLRTANGSDLLPSLLPAHPVSVAGIAAGYVETARLRQLDVVVSLDATRRQLEEALALAESNLRPADNEAKPDGYELSERERDVLTAITHGLSNKEIADRLYISVHTVISHRKNIIAKTGIKSVSGLTVYALMRGLIDEKDVM